MQTVGRILIGIGVAMIGYAMVMNVSLPGGGYDGIANHDMMNQRLLYGVVGAGSVISGFLALILNAVRR